MESADLAKRSALSQADIPIKERIQNSDTWIPCSEGYSSHFFHMIENGAAEYRSSVDIPIKESIQYSDT